MTACSACAYAKPTACTIRVLPLNAHAITSQPSSGEGFGLAGRCRRAPITVLGQRGRGRSRQRILFWLPPRKHVYQRSIFFYGVLAAGDHCMCHIHRRKTAVWVDGQVGICHGGRTCSTNLCTNDRRIMSCLLCLTQTVPTM